MLNLRVGLLEKYDLLDFITASLMSLERKRAMMGGVLSLRDGRVCAMSMVSMREGMLGRLLLSSAILRMGDIAE